MIEDNLKKLNITLPAAAAPVGSYVAAKIVGKLLYISGQISIDENGNLIKGKVGKDYNVEQGYEAAKRCALSIISQAKKACGNLEMINKCIKLGGFVNTDDQFSDHALVMDGASKLMISILEDKGWHARFAVGASSLPLNMAVEVDAIFELQN